LVIFAGLLGVTGQFVLKAGMSSMGPLALRPDTLAATILALALNPIVILGLAIYGAGTFFWLIALSRVDLSYAYPLASLNYLFVLAGSWWLLGEQPSLTRLAGVLAICTGVWAISRTRASTTASPRRTAALSAPPMPGGTEA